MHHVDQKEDDRENCRQRPPDPDYAAHVADDVGVLLRCPSRQKPLASRSARSLRLRTADTVAKAGPARIGRPFLGDDLGLELLGACFFLCRQATGWPAGRPRLRSRGPVSVGMPLAGTV